MARLSPFKRTRRPDDADQSAGSEPELTTQPPNGEQAPPKAPAPELPPTEAVTEEEQSGDATAEQSESEEQADAEQRRGVGKEKKSRPPRAPVANLSRVRRERRALMREREARIRDLGGLMLEMYRRDQFREDLIVEHCAQAMGIENRIHELEAILMRASSRRATPGPQCACGAPLLFGARFCANCGRPTDLASAGELCARCGQALNAGATFCPSCGVIVGAGAEMSDEDEQTMEHAPLAEPKDASEQIEGGEA